RLRAGSRAGPSIVRTTVAFGEGGQPDLHQRLFRRNRSPPTLITAQVNNRERLRAPNHLCARDTTARTHDARGRPFCHKGDSLHSLDYTTLQNGARIPSPNLAIFCHELSG